MNGKEEEIYNILYKKKEIDDKTPKLRTEDDKKKLKSLSYKMRKFPKDLIDDIKKKFPFLQRTPKTAEQRKEQDKECHRQKRSAESEIDKEIRQTQDKITKHKRYKREPTFMGPLHYTLIHFTLFTIHYTLYTYTLIHLYTIHLYTLTLI